MHLPPIDRSNPPAAFPTILARLACLHKGNYTKDYIWYVRPQTADQRSAADEAVRPTIRETCSTLFLSAVFGETVDFSKEKSRIGTIEGWTLVFFSGHGGSA
jgi:hypothetical protein